MKRVTQEESQYYIKLKQHQFRKADAFTLIPEENGWDTVVYLANAVLDPSGAVRAPEYVYVLVNKSVPNMVKIGMTTNTPDERARQISATNIFLHIVLIHIAKCLLLIRILRKK